MPLILLGVNQRKSAAVESWDVMASFLLVMYTRGMRGRDGTVTEKREKMLFVKNNMHFYVIDVFSQTMCGIKKTEYRII